VSRLGRPFDWCGVRDRLFRGQTVRVEPPKLSPDKLDRIFGFDYPDIGYWYGWQPMPEGIQVYYYCPDGTFIPPDR
jgi:hypothetical protein